MRSRESRVSRSMDECQASWWEIGDMRTGCFESLGSPICLGSLPGCFSGYDCCCGDRIDVVILEHPTWAIGGARQL